MNQSTTAVKAVVVFPIRSVMDMKDRKMSKTVTDSDFRRLVESKNVRKAVMVKDGKVFKYGYDK